MRQDVLYVGLIDLVASFDGGHNWTSVGHTYEDNAYTHSDQHAIAVNPSNPNELLVGNDGGIYKLQVEPSTGKWSFDTTLNSGITITQFYRAAFHPSDANRLIGGAQDNASPVLLGDPRKWGNVGGGDGGFAAINRNEPDVQYATSQGLDILRTDQAWKPGSVTDITGNWSSEIRTFIAPIVLDPNDPKLLYAGTNYLWRWDDRNLEWTAHLGDQILANDDGKDALTYIAIAPSASKRIYTASQQGQLWMSADNGGHWTRIDRGLPHYWITSIAVSPQEPDKILVSLSGTASRTGVHPGHVWICENTGSAARKWRPIIGTGSGMLPNIPVNSISLDPSNPNSIYYAGTDIGFFVSKDGGTSWQDASTSLGLPNVQVNDVQFVPGTGYLMAATFGRGMWRIKLPIEVKPSYFKAVQKNVQLGIHTHQTAARANK